MKGWSNPRGKKSTIKVAIVHPCDTVSLAVEAARLHLIEPILLGRLIESGVARSAGLNIDGMEIASSDHSHDPPRRPSSWSGQAGLRP